MAGSDITVSGLVADGDVKGVKLKWVVTDPWPKDLHYSLDVVEIWAATANDRAHASFAKVGEGGTDFLHAGLQRGDVRYYWARARNKVPASVGGPGYSAWHPAGATAGVQGVEVSGDLVLGVNGYWRHPSGLLEQWGSATILSGGGSRDIPYNTAWTGGCFSVLPALSMPNDPTKLYCIKLESIGDTEFTVSVVCIASGGTISTPAVDFYWRALGY